MKYYTLEFETAQGEEGNSFEYISPKQCMQCGLKTFQIRDQFLVPEDCVTHVDVLLWGIPEFPAMMVAGLLVVEADLGRQIQQEGLTGLEYIPATVQLAEDEQPVDIPSYHYARVTGRAVSNDVWDRIEAVCTKCGAARTKFIYTPTRKVELIPPWPTADFCRIRERRAGILVSARVVAFLRSHTPEFESHVRLKDAGGQ